MVLVKDGDDRSAATTASTPSASSRVAEAACDRRQPSEPVGDDDHDNAERQQRDDGLLVLDPQKDDQEYRRQDQRRSARQDRSALPPAPPAPCHTRSLSFSGIRPVGRHAITAITTREGEHILVGASERQGDRADGLQRGEQKAAEDRAVDTAEPTDDGGAEIPPRRDRARCRN